MVISNSRPIIYAAVLLSFLSICIITINAFYYHFPGNNYFPDNTPYITFSLLLMYCGFVLQFGKASQLAAIVKELVFFLLVMAVIALATNAAQLTPFSPIDKHIIAIETSLHINMKAIIAWTHTKPQLMQLLDFIYNTLPYQMIAFPLLIIITKRWDYIREYYFLLLASAIIGFSFYYFFPTTAPASVIESHNFSEAQRATGLKFMQIHHYIQPSTLDGGMIALPSFHVIWAWFCLYTLRIWPIGFIIMLPINLLLVASCVLLGWHYPTDILGGIVVIFMSHSLYWSTRNIYYTHRSTYINELE